MTVSLAGPMADPPPLPAVAFTLHPIGLAHTVARRRAPIPKYFVSKGRATLEIFQPYLPGLQGLYGGCDLWVVAIHAPSGDSEREASGGPGGRAGVFATTTMERPNPIEFLRVNLLDLDVERGFLFVEGLDVEDGMPILDLRPATTPHHRLNRP